MYPLALLCASLMGLTTFSRLSKTRRKRAVPGDWATPEAVQSFTTLNTTQSLSPESRAVALDPSGDLVLAGGSDGKANVFSIHQNKIVQELEVGSRVTDALWLGSRPALATSAGTVQIFENGVETSRFSGHAGEVTALALHPSGEILASTGIDKSYIFYDLTSSLQALQISTDCGNTKQSSLQSIQSQLLTIA